MTNTLELTLLSLKLPQITSVGEVHAKRLFQFEKEDIFVSLLAVHLTINNGDFIVVFSDIYIMV